MTISIYYMTDDENPLGSEEEKSANAMAQGKDALVQPLMTRSRGLFGTTNAPAKPPTETPNEFILLAHTDTGRSPSTIGGLSPKKLADTFNRIFSKQQEKEKITDIFLISCEAGMGNPSLAQAFAKAMLDHQFSNIKIRAVAHPDGKLVGGGVEVITRPGQVTGGTIGQVNGYFYGNEESKEFHQYEKLINKGHKRTSEESALFHQLKLRYHTFDRKQAVIVDLVTDLEDMKAPYNTFNADGPIAKLSADMAITLSFLKKKKTLLTFKTDESNVIRAIDQIITHVESNPTLAHQQIIEQLKNLRKQKSTSWTSWATGVVGVNSVTKLLDDYIVELNARLHKINSTSCNMPPEEARSRHVTEESPLLGNRPFQPKNIEAQLREYAAQRKDEWGFHWDFLYLKTLSFWVSDRISALAKHMGLIEKSTDYLNIKHRDVKVSAAEALANRIEAFRLAPFSQVDPLNPTEEQALNEGRLGLIVKTATLPHNFPWPVNRSDEPMHDRNYRSCQH